MKAQLHNALRTCLMTILFMVLTSMHTGSDFLSRLADSLALYQSKFLREKVYLHIDRSYFQPGDDIWFKGYVVNSLDNRLSVLSKTLFVAIVSPAGDIVLSGQYLIRNGRAFGDFALSPALEPGQYELIAYSSWMKNFSPDDVFRQPINISTDIVPNLFVDARFSQDVYADQQRASLTDRVVDFEGNGLENLKMRYTVSNGFELLKDEKVKVVEQGRLDLDFELPAKKGFVHYVMRIEGEHDGQPFHYQWLIPTEDRDFDLQFMPEGGQSLAGLSQKMAFKCVDNFGRNTTFEAIIIDNNGTVVDTIASTYQGMGSFEWLPQSGKQYVAKMIDPASSEEFPLPMAVAQGATLALGYQSPDTLSIKVMSTLKRSAAYFLTVVHQDKLVWSKALTLDGDTTISLHDDLFPVGVNRVTAFNDKGLPVSERLVFVHADRKLNVSIDTDRQVYAPRDQVQGRLSVQDASGRPVRGVFSLAVTDHYLSNINSTATASILSSMLLTSELKGQVPTPDYYFNDDNPYAAEALDLVMLTHGWRRFLWDYVLLKDLQQEPSPVDQDMKSGTVYDKKGNAVPGAEVQIVQLGEMNAYFTETNERGKFYLPFQISSNASMNFVFNASIPGKSKPLEVRLDTEDNDPFREAIVHQLLPTAGDLATTERARAKSKKGQDVFEHFNFGGNYTLLKEVAVIGERMADDGIVDKAEKYELRNQMSVMSHYFVQSRKVDQLSFVSNTTTNTGTGGGGFIDIVKQMTNIYKYNPETGYVILRTNDLLQNSEKRLGALVVLNGTSVGQDLRVLNHLTQTEIEKIDVIKTSAMAVYYGNRAAAGAILVTTKQGIKAGNSESHIDQSVESTVAVDNNYSVVREFYVPKYNTEEEHLSVNPDIRKTLYWNAELVTDENGEAGFAFYTDDRQTRLQIAVQGMSGDGLFGFQSQSIAVDKASVAKRE